VVLAPTQTAGSTGKPHHLLYRALTNRAQTGFLLEYRRKREAMPQDSVAIIENFWRDVWKQPQNPEAIDHFVQEDFVITSGGRDVVGREAFKTWMMDFEAKVHHFEFHVVETFQNQDGSRVTSRWRITGRNNGLRGTEPNDAPFEMCGTAVWKLGQMASYATTGWSGMRSRSTALSRGRTAGITSSETGSQMAKFDGPYLRVCGRAGRQDDIKPKVRGDAQRWSLPQCSSKWTSGTNGHVGYPGMNGSKADAP
jgi:hypothetical protein